MELSIKPFIEHKKIIHLVGIGGVSMNSLGELLLSMGVPVTGSDRAHSAVTERLERLSRVRPSSSVRLPYTTITLRSSVRMS